MRATKILAIVGIVAALGGVMSLIHIQQVNAFLLGQGPPSNFPHSPLGAVRGELGALRGDLSALRGDIVGALRGGTSGGGGGCPQCGT